MTEQSIYEEIAERTGGDIYLGVVGPVRTGKSTFIQKFMDAVVIPNIPDGYEKARAMDEIPQSANGRTVMTTEPKFIPGEAVHVVVGDARMRVRMVDCVGYIVPEALGQTEDGTPRMVHTPWSEEAIPFERAAELGTQKVIRDHSTIGILVTTDGSFGEFSRAAYVEAEARVARELSALSKPYVIILNSATPESEESTALAYELEKKYGAPVALVNCMTLDAEDIRHIFELALHEFPISRIGIRLPAFCYALPKEHPLRKELRAAMRQAVDNAAKMGEIATAFATATPPIASYRVSAIDTGTGSATVDATLCDGIFYQTLREMTGLPIENEAALLPILCELAETKRAYDRVASALSEVEEKGYGIVMPQMEELQLDEPKLVKQGGSHGVRLRASAQSIHMIRASIEAEIHPTVGTEAQSEELVKFLLQEFEEDPSKIWETNIFGKNVFELVNEELHNKLSHMPDESRKRLSETLERIINEGSNGLICILL